jgi:hypothetical protein
MGNGQPVSTDRAAVPDARRLITGRDADVPEMTAARRQLATRAEESAA